jgi:hypothetical protein
MNKIITLLISLSMTSVVVFAIPPGQWQCMAIDSQQQNFTSTGSSQEAAMHAAVTVCKQQSSRAKSCKSAQSFCEQGPLSLNDDHCLVTDNAGHSWDTNGEDACKTAMNMCNQFLYLEAGPRGQCSVKHGRDAN